MSNPPLIAGADETRSDSSGHVPAATHKPRVLIVEDEALVAADIWQRLDKLGYEPAGIAVTGREAIELARAGRPDLVLMDIMLEGEMDGTEAARLIRRELALPVIYSSASTAPANLWHAKTSEPYGYLVKPCTDRDLSIAIDFALHKHQLEQERARLAAALQKALDEVKTLRGLLPVCAWCYRIHDDEGYWKRVDVYLKENAGVDVTHSICPACAESVKRRPLAPRPDGAAV